MFIIKRASYIEEKRDIIREILTTSPKTYNVMADIRNGNIVLIERPKAKYYIKIGKLKLSSSKYTQKIIHKLASELNTLIQRYNGKSLICKSRVKSEFGKSGLLDIAYVMSVDNPYYKCAGDMMLDDKNVIKYNLNIA